MRLLPGRIQFFVEQEKAALEELPLFVPLLRYYSFFAAA